jgi:hypothetical protein
MTDLEQLRLRDYRPVPSLSAPSHRVERETYEIYFRFLETEDEYFDYSPCDPPPTGRWCISALNLPAEVLRLVYSENARALIPGLGH